MFKRVERKRKRREEDEESGSDQDTDSNTSSERESVQLDDLDAKEGVASEDDGLDEDPPMSVAEALKDPIYLISFEPTVYGCVFCKGRLIKNTGMAAAHKNANAHKRRLQHFKLLSAGVDPRSDAWELVRSIYSTTHVQGPEPQEPSKRALKRQAKQASIHEKRKRHKELKAKAAAKKTIKKLSKVDEIGPASPSTMNLRSSLDSQTQSLQTRKKKRLENDALPNTVMGSRDPSAKSSSHTKASNHSKKSVHKSRPQTTTKTSKLA